MFRFDVWIRFNYGNGWLVDYTFDDGWFDIVWIPVLLCIRYYTGAYPLFVEIVDFHWFDSLILSRFSSRAFLKPVSHAHTFWYHHDS